MNTFRTATKVAFLIVCILVIVQFVWWYNILPDIMPSHFNAQGEVDGTMSKSNYYVFMGLLHAMFMIGFPLTAVMMDKMPISLINFPNKVYWLAPERKEESLKGANMILLQVGILSMGLMAALFHLSSLVAIKTRPSIAPEFLWIMGLYLVVVFLLIGFLLFKYRLPADLKEASSRISTQIER